MPIDQTLPDDVADSLVKAMTTTRFKDSNYFAPHAYILSSTGENEAGLWMLMRDAVAAYGYWRPFVMKTKTGDVTVSWKYLDLPDGFTYWVMRKWMNPPKDWVYNPADAYALNRRPTNQNEVTE